MPTASFLVPRLLSERALPFLALRPRCPPGAATVDAFRSPASRLSIAPRVLRVRTSGLCPAATCCRAVEHGLRELVPSSHRGVLHAVFFLRTSRRFLPSTSTVGVPSCIWCWIAGALLVAFDALFFLLSLIVAMLAQQLLGCCSFAWARLRGDAHVLNCTPGAFTFFRPGLCRPLRGTACRMGSKLR